MVLVCCCGAVRSLRRRSSIKQVISGHYNCFVVLDGVVKLGEKIWLLC